MSAARPFASPTRADRIDIEAWADGDGFLLGIGERRIAARAEIRADDLAVWLDGEAAHMPRSRARRADSSVHACWSHPVSIEFDPLRRAEAEDEDDGMLSAPMPGKIVRQPVVAGERVARGAPLLVLEAMKMEHTITAPRDGRIVRLHYTEGDQVEEGAVLIDFEIVGEGGSRPRLELAPVALDSAGLCPILCLHTMRLGWCRKGPAAAMHTNFWL